MKDDELRGALRAAVPEPPDDSSWAGRARDRARRYATTRRTAGIGAAVVALIGAVLWWPAVGGQGRTAVPAEQPMVTAAASTAGNPDCTDGLTGKTTLKPRGDTRVVRMSLCPRSDGPTFSTPSDSVTFALRDVPSAVFDAVLDLPKEGSRDPDCSRADDRRYLVVFTLADGSRQVLEAATPNACGVTEGSDLLLRWRSLLKTLNTAWSDKRALETSDAAPAECLPFDRPGLLPPTISDVTSGAICGFDSSGQVLQSSTQVPEGQLKVLLGDLEANSARGDNIDSRLDGTVLTLRNAWGDPLVLWSVGADQWFAFMPDGRQWYWSPGPEARDVLSALSGQLTPVEPSPGTVQPGQVTPTASVAPGPTALEACRGLQPSSSPTTVPTTASRLRLCPTGWYTNLAFAPLDTVDGERAAAVLNVLARQPRLTGQMACTAELGPDFLLVAETDGQAPVVMVLQLYGCRVAGILAAPRGGASAVLDSFKTQLAEQRSAAPSTWQRAGSLCGSLAEQPSSVMQVDPKAVTGGRLCIYPAAAEVASRELPVDENLAKRIAADVSAHNAPVSPASCPNRLPHRRLALTNAYGDVLLLTEACWGWQYNDGSANRQWAPSSAVAKKLTALAKA